MVVKSIENFLVTLGKKCIFTKVTKSVPSQIQHDCARSEKRFNMIIDFFDPEQVKSDKKIMYLFFFKLYSATKYNCPFFI